MDGFLITYNIYLFILEIFAILFRALFDLCQLTIWYNLDNLLV